LTLPCVTRSPVAQQRPRLDPQPLRNPRDVVDRHVPLRALDAAEVGPVDPALVRKRLLAEPVRGAQPNCLRLTFETCDKSFLYHLWTGTREGEDMLEWIKTLGQLIISWPVVAVVVVVVFRRQIRAIFERLVDSSGGKAVIGPLRIELGKLADEGKTAVGRVNRVSEVMAESRLLELEITLQEFSSRFTDDQKRRLEQCIEELRSLTAKGRKARGA
jgi:hypothetical protein